MKDSLEQPFNVMRHKRWETAPRVPSIAAFLFPGAMAVGGTAAFLALTATYIGVTLVASWAINALMPRPNFGSTGSRGLLVNTRDATGVQDAVYGEIRKGGVITYMEATGTDNEYLHMIITVAGHEINSFEQFYINDEAVTLDSSGFVTETDYSDADGNKKILIKEFTGSPTQNVYTTLNALTDGPNWANKQTGDDTNFRGQGIACFYVRMEYDQNVFAQGVPLFTTRVKGKKVFDPRNSTTAYSSNSALCVRDYLISKYGLDSSGDINETTFSTAANVCDETVSLSAGGTEKRYECHGVISLDRAPGDILADLMTSCQGSLFWGQGKWHLKAGDYNASVETFTMDDFRGPITLETKHSRRNNFNVVRGTFNDASSDYISTDYPEVRSTTFISDDNNIESAIDLPLPFTTSKTMAQRLAKLTLFRSREQLTLSADFSLRAFDVEVGDVVAITNSRYGFSAKEFEVVGWKFFNDGENASQKVNLTLRETSSAAYDWNAEESDFTSNNTTLADPGAGLTINNLTASGGGSTQGDGTFINSVILSWTAPSNVFVNHYEIQWKPTADSNYNSTTTPETSIELSPLIDGTEYTLRVRAITTDGRQGAFASVTFTGGGDVTAPGLPTSISAVGGFKYIDIKWTNPADSDLNFVEIYENSSNTSSGASLVGTSSGSSFTRTNLGLNQTKYYFLKSVDFSNNKSAFSSGVSATTTYLDDPDFENGIRQIFIDAGLDVIEPVSSLPSSGDFTGQQVFLTSDNKLYHWNGSSWAAIVADGGVSNFNELQGSIAASQIPSGVISEAKLASNSVTSAKISANAIGANAIAAGVITGDKITANTITGGLLATSGIITSAAQISDAIISNAKISDLSASKINTGTLDASNITVSNLNASSITAGTLDVDRFPALGQANTTTFSNSLTRNGTAATVSVSFSGVKTGATIVCIASVGGHANNVASPYLVVTPTASNVSLDSTATQDVNAKEGSITISALRRFYPVISTGTTTSTSGSIGFSIQLRGNDSGSGGSQGRVAALILSG